MSQKVFLNPGEFYFGDTASQIHTLLGSCIAITLWHQRLHIGGMCHYVLPQKKPRSSEKNLDGRYADEAMRMFKRECAARGTKIKEYQVKIFGGSYAITQKNMAQESRIGHKNVEAAYTLLKQEGADILVSHVGATGSRKVVLDLNNGDVWVRHDEHITD
ncbi:MAG: chemotaxis protein CheD [Methylococcales bacterium]|jgi:chemotaxis protein CheD|nr:chemotaxis protein CheD [Methylococcales bacterium]MBT7442455.1 chemotaxis protein CheD [Methylococcales bacterium]